ncbi:MAG: DnaJ domain-containing protein [Gammaproteobacteria bacterium]|nr:DnaJ domain-containing protein [Gammaproteobacteria bacterium]MCF6229579.1 DnaJ domain-containing protein [Gammaproteobacteria bacterium]
MEFKDYYKIMGVERTATQDDIKRAYRKLSRKYHPDVSKEPDAEEHFKSVGEAYEVLKDPEKRAAYDQLGMDWKSGQDFRPPPEWDQGFEFRGGGFTDGDASQFSDFFESLFGRANAARGRAGGEHFSMGGEDTHAKVFINLEDAYHGATRTITLRHTELGADGRPQLKNRTLNVKIPKGVHQGQHIRLSGQGGAGAGQGKAGDLYLEIEFEPHSFYRVEGRDVYLDLPVAPWEAALGAKVSVPTPGGKVELKVPPGSCSGAKMRLKGKGIPGKSVGDFYVVLQVVLPPAESDEAKALYREMAQKMAFNPRAALGV